MPKMLIRRAAASLEDVVEKVEHGFYGLEVGSSLFNPVAVCEIGVGAGVAEGVVLGTQQVYERVVGGESGGCLFQRCQWCETESRSNVATVDERLQFAAVGIDERAYAA